MSVGLLVQHLGLEVMPETTEVWVYDEAKGVGGYQPKPTGNYVIAMAEQPDSEQTKILRAACRQATPECLAVHLGNLALHKRIAKLSDRGVLALVSDYAGELSGYAEMAVVDACQEIKRHCESDFFPQLATILKIVQRQDAMYRQALARAEAQAQNHKAITHNPNAIYSAVPPAKRRLSYRDELKSHWDERHYDEAIRDALHMLDYAKQNPTIVNPDDWSKRVEQLMAERLTAKAVGEN